MKTSSRPLHRFLQRAKKLLLKPVQDLRTLLLLVHRSLRQHALSTLVTAASLALAGGLLMSVWVVKERAQSSFTSTTTGFDAVLGARGSKLQLVLNALFHLEASPGNVGPDDVAAIRRHPAVKAAIPIAVGDNYRGWRIVGTLPDLFAVEYAPGQTFRAQPGGRLFTSGEAQVREAVAGWLAARQLGLEVGDTFQPYHGLSFDPAAKHEETYTIVGVLEPTGTPADRVLWIPLAGVQTMTGHAEAAKHDVSAVLIQLRAPTAGFMLDMMYNRQGNRLTFAYPIGAIMADLFGKIGWFDRVLALVAYLVGLVAAASVLASIYASMHARRRDHAILRALGARRRVLFSAIVTEAAAIGALGAVASLALYAGLYTGVAAVVRAQTGIVLPLEFSHPVLWLCPLGLVAAAALAGLIPALKAYRTPVAPALAPQS